jgi:hypothetical protein
VRENTIEKALRQAYRLREDYCDSKAPRIEINHWDCEKCEINELCRLLCDLESMKWRKPDQVGVR